MEDTIEITKTLNAPIKSVFDAWTKKEELEQWFAPENMTTTVQKLSVVAGGEYKITMKNAEGAEYVVGGVFKEVNAPEKLVFSWRWISPEPGQETLITVEFKEVSGKTEMRFVHSGFKQEEFKKNHEEGWVSTFNKLEKQFA